MARPSAARASSALPLRLFAVLALSFGCNAIFGIELGKPEPDAAGGASAGMPAGGGASGSTSTAGAASAGASARSNGGSSGKGEQAGGAAGGTSMGAGTSANGGSGGRGSGGSAMGGKGGGGTGGSAMASGGNGGTSNPSAGGAAGEECSCSASPVDSDPLLLQDFENEASALVARPGRTGAFYSYPSDVGNPTITCNGDDGNCYSLCIRGKLDGTGYPVAGIGVDLDNAGTQHTYDVSAYSGVEFRVRGAVPSDAVARFNVPGKATTDVSYGGSCVAANGLQCSDAYKAEFSVTENFTKVSVNFTSLGQGNGGSSWSVPWGVPAVWNPAQVLSLQWEIASSVETVSEQPYYLCIDDVKFVAAPARTLRTEYDFESSADGFDVKSSGTNATVTQTSSTSAVGAGSLELSLSGSTNLGCNGGVLPCATNTTVGNCALVAGCTWSGSACQGTPTPCNQITDYVACGQTLNCSYDFQSGAVALDDPSLNPGDTVSAWLRLPDEQLFFDVFLQDASFAWQTQLLVPNNSRRDDWFYVEFTVPGDIAVPIHGLGFQLGTSPSFQGAVFIDDVRIYSP